MDKIKITGDSWASIRIDIGNLINTNCFLNPNLNKQFEHIEMIYHYTDLKGFLSIVDTQSMFCTNLKYLNDKKEYDFGIDLILEVSNKLKNADFEPKIMSMIIQQINKINNSERYVTCFSKSGDLLSQWRAYSNNGKGIAIGFDLHTFDKSVDKFITGTHIEYSKKTQLKSIEEIIRIIVNYFVQRKEDIDWEDYGFEWLVTSVIYDCLGEVIASYKSEQFVDEREYRYEYCVDDNFNKVQNSALLFRNSDNLIIPYVLLKSKKEKFIEKKNNGAFENIGSNPVFAIDKLPIKEIVIGPSLDFESIQSSVKQVLNNAGYNNVKIKKSEIPYRI